MIEYEEFSATLNSHGYEFLKIIGTGGFSNVFLCYCKKYNQNFAIKRAIKKRISKDEFTTLVSLTHPNIIKLYDVFEDDSATYLVMEYCPNGTIDRKGRLTYNQFIFYSKQILNALSYCHSKNISHRDIKPENVFLDQYDNVKLADFGMSKIFDKQEKSKEKCGSLKFLPPEMYQSKEICPFKADIWSLGITFFMMITGAYPFKYKTHEQLKESIMMGILNFSKFNVDQGIRILINKMVQPKAELRPSAEELLKSPIFIENTQTNVSKLPILALNQTKRRFSRNILLSMSLNHRGFQQDKIDETNKKKVANINTCRSINFIPQIQPIYTNNLAVKK